jgi:regulator of protease activity HflC (stomatin/prohibitin superfamily)
MAFGGSPSGILLPLAFVFGVFILIVWASLRRVPPGANWTVERLGRFSRLLLPGFHLVMPFVERVGARIDMGDSALDVPPQRATSRDGVAVDVGAEVTWRVTDAVKVAYGVADMRTALIKLAGTHAAAVIGTRPAADLSADRTGVNDTIQQRVESAAAEFGVKVLRLELKNVVPPG